MDSFEWNKIFGAVLATALFVAALNTLVTGVMAPEKAKLPGMEIAVQDDHGPSNGPAVAEPKPDWGTVLPAADIAAGEKVHVRCQQCHDFAKGGPDKIGPNLYGVVGANFGRSATYANSPGYSPGMKAMAAKTWGYDELNDFVKNPKATVPGTKMSYAGLSKVQDRINLVAYLRTLSDSPLAIPAPNPVPEPAPAGDGTGEAPAGELQAPPPGTVPAEGAAPGTTPVPAPGSPASPAPATPAAPPAAPGH